MTDGQWQAGSRRIRHADLLMGERHDLRLEPHGWDSPGFDAGAAGAAVRGRRPRTAGRWSPTRACRSASPQEIAPVSIARDRGRAAASSTSGRT